MKTTTVVLAGTLLLGAICWVPESASGQTAIPVLVGPLNDGTPPPPQPPLDTGPVREIKEFQLREGTASLCRVPSPRRGMIQAASEAPRTSAFPIDLTTRRLLMQERYRRLRLVFVSATVYDHRWSFVRWRANGAGNRNFAAWSNVDFNHFTGIGGFDLSGLRFSFFMPVTNQDTVRLKARMEAAGGQYVPPQPPDLPEWEPAFVLVEGDPTDMDGALGYLALVEVVIPGTPSTFAAALAADIADETTAPVSNARFTGAEDSSGYFDYGLLRGLELDQGVALTTGLFTSWNTGDSGLVGDAPIDPSSRTSYPWNLPGDEDLFFRVVGHDTWDAAVLEFDVFCVNGQLVIDYQFGTEEYDEYVEEFNDAFMITVDGVPVSLVPDCSDIVGVQSASLAKNRHLFLGDDEDIDADGMVDPAYESTKVEYDGMTVRLRANALVTAGASHHVRIVIADVNDNELDAALFLGQGSLKTIQPTP